ncbi:hypothetical protein [Haloarcula argentinensis]|uniref:Restriction endonuclease n=1 Tax=Haloarcula argentinensis TaxID=43776 RepID=A0ABU2F027_HALAR|nr:hypothetical protein [Haloarcula argentinensis]EMA18539.1 hypothetical protein C443_18614 [Haloarcula argentinensis DSM 12282]MDS0253903.1 hypothetical protein [Haloarcula argentinensis]
MATAASGLSEPQVLARTKDRLFADREDAYVVADTQFAQQRWLDDTPIEASVQATLAPFNHVRVGTGYPDLVGVQTLSTDLLSVDRLGDRPPLIAVEAKGYTGNSGVDAERGVVQAHDRLNEANVAFLTAPRSGISTAARTMARELNVGVLGVESDGSVSILERPRVVGHGSMDAASAIRFQASAQGVADQNFGLNHPKNYIAVPLAVHHDGDTRDLIAAHVVGAVDGALAGAAFLNLIDTGQGTLTLTPLGREVVRFALRTVGDVDDALRQFEDWQRSRRRFIDIAPQWGQLVRRVVSEYPATDLLVDGLYACHRDGYESPSLVEFVEYLHALHPEFTVELFLRGDEAVRQRVLTGDGDLRGSELTDGSVYHSPTVFQLKAILYHAGIVTDRGAEPSNLAPETDEWALCDPLA